MLAVVLEQVLVRVLALVLHQVTSSQVLLGAALFRVILILCIIIIVLLILISPTIIPACGRKKQKPDSKKHSSTECHALSCFNTLVVDQAK